MCKIDGLSLNEITDTIVGTTRQRYLQEIDSIHSCVHSDPTQTNDDWMFWKNEYTINTFPRQTVLPDQYHFEIEMMLKHFENITKKIYLLDLIQKYQKFDSYVMRMASLHASIESRRIRSLLLSKDGKKKLMYLLKAKLYTYEKLLKHTPISLKILFVSEC